MGEADLERQPRTGVTAPVAGPRSSVPAPDPELGEGPRGPRRTPVPAEGPPAVGKGLEGELGAMAGTSGQREAPLRVQAPLAGLPAPPQTHPAPAGQPLSLP